MVLISSGFTVSARPNIMNLIFKININNTKNDAIFLLLNVNVTKRRKEFILENNLKENINYIIA